MIEPSFMKIGFSFGRCVRDIVKGEVNIDNVVVIISRTSIPSREYIQKVVDSYIFIQDYLFGLDRDKCISIAEHIWDSQLLFQPREKGALATRVPENLVWMNLIPDSHLEDGVLSNLLKNYLMTVKLIGIEDSSHKVRHYGRTQ